ncbi:hypothetical protein Daus18300_005964 [Diaporthe australafricana]|uniref:Rhodopsin domain-containing protein n=1 Tax=Diaporthe australafricana TaxID=127596 RepID=A0ABR3WYR9_9PEZI
MSEVDPIIEAIFGPLPPGTDLNENPIIGNDVAVAVLLGIATAAVVTRLICRHFTSSPLKADDSVIVAALILTYATVDVAMAAKLLYAYSFVFAAAITLTKSSILLLYTRIFEVSDSRFRTLLWTAAFFVAAYPLTFVIGMASCCKPISFYWTQFAGDTDGHCPLKTGLFFVVMAIINLFIDFVILVLPIPSILRLQMSWRKKAGVCGIMLLGGFGGPGSKSVHHRKDEDELRLTKNNYSMTNIVTSGGSADNEAVPDEGIIVRSEVTLQRS